MPKKYNEIFHDRGDAHRRSYVASATCLAAVGDTRESDKIPPLLLLSTVVLKTLPHVEELWTYARASMLALMVSPS